MRASPLGLLFSLLSAGLAAIGVAALRAGELLVGAAALALAVWMATLAAAVLRRR